MITAAVGTVGEVTAKVGVMEVSVMAVVTTIRQASVWQKGSKKIVHL